jgi:hypothetical protein
MVIKNSDLFNSSQSIFLVLDRVYIKLFHDYSWYSEDIEEDSVRGSIFYAYEEQPTLSVASITVADVSSDTAEPDISGIKPEYVDVVDALLKSEISRQFNVTRWMSSQLNVFNSLKVLVTAYITTDKEKQWQYIALRLSNNNQKFVIIGSFDIAKADELAELIWKSLHSVNFKL